MKIIVIYRCDNGYKCGCCKEEWSDYDTYDIEDEDAKEWAKQHAEQIKEWYEAEKCGRYKIESVHIISATVIEDGELVKLPE